MPVCGDLEGSGSQLVKSGFAGTLPFPCLNKETFFFKSSVVFFSFRLSCEMFGSVASCSAVGLGFLGPASVA